MASVDVQINAAPDVGCVNTNGATLDTLQVWIGNFTGLWNAFFRFNNVIIPKSATIEVNTYLSLCCKMWGTSNAHYVIVGNDADNAVAPTTCAQYLALAQTGVTVSWDPANWSNNVYYNSPSITPIVQAIVNRAGWVSGNSMQILVLRGTSSDVRSVYEGTIVTQAAKLHAEYTGGSGLSAKRTLLGVGL
jgi:hypothetical protein